MPWLVPAERVDSCREPYSSSRQCCTKASCQTGSPTMLWLVPAERVDSCREPSSSSRHQLTSSCRRLLKTVPFLSWLVRGMASPGAMQGHPPTLPGCLWLVGGWNPKMGLVGYQPKIAWHTFGPEWADPDIIRVPGLRPRYTAQSGRPGSTTAYLEVVRGLCDPPEVDAHRPNEPVA